MVYLFCPRSDVSLFYDVCNCARYLRNSPSRASRAGAPIHLLLVNLELREWSLSLRLSRSSSYQPRMGNHGGIYHVHVEVRKISISQKAKFN